MPASERSQAKLFLRGTSAAFRIKWMDIIALLCQKHAYEFQEDCSPAQALAQRCNAAALLSKSASHVPTGKGSYALCCALMKCRWVLACQFGSSP